MEALRQKVICLTFLLAVVGLVSVTIIQSEWMVEDNFSDHSSQTHGELFRGYEPQSGDFVFREGRGFWSPLFKRANWRFGYTHVGVIVRESNQLYVLHAEADDFRLSGGVQKTSFENFVLDAETFTIKKNLMFSSVKERFVEELYAMLKASLKFDSDFDLGDEGQKVYCTELVWLSAKRAGVESLGEVMSLRGRQVILVDSIYSSSLLSETFGKRQVGRSRL